MNKEDQLQSLDESRNKWEISYEAYVLARDRIINETIKGCWFCLDTNSRYCICSEWGYKKYIY